MTDTQKQEILNLKKQGSSYRKIAALLSLPENTIKSFLRREQKQNGSRVCKNCNKKLELIPKHRAKMFCSAGCRITYWRKSKKEGNFYDTKCG